MNKPFYLVSKTTDNKYPYFFKNKLIDNHIYLMQDSQNIPNALFILDTWNTHHFNPGNVDRYEPSEISYTVVLYKNSNDISIEKIKGGNDDIKILVYKKDNKMKYIAMLKYN